MISAAFWIRILVPHKSLLFCVSEATVQQVTASGPLIGYKLAQLISPSDDVAVFGTLSHPVHAVNLLETINRIHRIYNDPFIIAIDASLGRRDHIGYITLGSGALRPGLGVKKAA